MTQFPKFNLHHLKLILSIDPQQNQLKFDRLSAYYVCWGDRGLGALSFIANGIEISQTLKGGIQRATPSCLFDEFD